MLKLVHCVSLQYDHPFRYEDLEGDQGSAELVGTAVSLPEDDEDISDYKFAKFAATYFQGSSTHTYIRRPLKQPLVNLKHEQDRVVSCITQITTEPIYIG